MRRRSRVGPRKGSQENCSETRCLPKRVRQSLNTQPGASGTQDVCIKCGLTFAVKPSPGYKSEKKRDLDIGVGFLFVDRPLPLAIDASEGDGGRSTLRGADQILQGQLHQTALSCACRDARWSPISGHNYRPAPHNKLASTVCLMWKESSDAKRTRRRAWITEGAVLAPKASRSPKVLLVSGVLQFYHRRQFGHRRIRLRGQRQPSGRPQTHAHPRAS